MFELARKFQQLSTPLQTYEKIPDWDGEFTVNVSLCPTTPNSQNANTLR